MLDFLKDQSRAIKSVLLTLESEHQHKEYIRITLSIQYSICIRYVEFFYFLLSQRFQSEKQQPNPLRNIILKN